MSLAHLTALESSALQQFKDAVVRSCPNTHMTFTLFGSRARAEGDENSDVDVLVVIDPYSEEKKRAIWTHGYEVFMTTDINVSPLVLSREQFEGLRSRERRIALDIARDGILL